MPTVMIRAVPRDDAASAVESQAATVFAALDERRPQGLVYLSLRQQDGTYVIVLHVPDGTDDPLPQLPEFLAFQEGLQSWLVEPAVPQPVRLVGAYADLRG